MSDLQPELWDPSPGEAPRFNVLEFFVEGSPAPGGSKRVFPIWRKGQEMPMLVRRGTKLWPLFNVTDDAGEGNKEWRKAVRIHAQDFMSGAKPFACALSVSFTFFLRRPLCHFRTGKFSELMRDDAPRYHTKAPDALKFARSTEDALTGVVWIDDSQNVTLSSAKKWCGPGEQSGCIVKLMPLE